METQALSSITPASEATCRQWSQACERADRTMSTGSLGVRPSKGVSCLYHLGRGRGLLNTYLFGMYELCKSRFSWHEGNECELCKSRSFWHAGNEHEPSKSTSFCCSLRPPASVQLSEAVSRHGSARTGEPCEQERELCESRSSWREDNECELCKSRSSWRVTNELELCES